MVDGLEVVLLDADGQAFGDDDLLPGSWPFVRAAPEHWDLNRWADQRIRIPLHGCQALVNPTWADTPTMWSTTLQGARERSPVFAHVAMHDEVTLRGGAQWILLHDRNRPIAPPTRDGKLGQIVVKDHGAAMWMDFDERQGACIAVDGSYDGPPPTTSTIQLNGNLGEMTFPSGVLRIAATAEDAYTDVMTRRAVVTVRYLPIRTYWLDVTVERAEKRFDPLTGYGTQRPAR